jgi:AcrR family transcriptional regulator
VDTQVESTKAAIRSAALDLFSTVGFSGTGIRSIAKEVGISLASLYHYMSTKEDLLVDMLTENILTLLRDAEVATQNVLKPTAKLSALVAVHVRVHTTQRLLCIVSDTELRALSGAEKERIISFRDTYEGMWRETLEAGQKSGEFHTRDVRVTTRALIEMCTGVAYWYNADGQLTVEELVELYVDLCLKALGATPPRRKREPR